MAQKRLCLSSLFFGDRNFPLATILKMKVAKRRLIEKMSLERCKSSRCGSYEAIWEFPRVLKHTVGNLSKPRRQRQRERRQTKGLMRQTIAVHVRYKSLYISLPFSAKQQREMTKFFVVWRT